MIAVRQGAAALKCHSSGMLFDLKAMGIDQPGS